MEKMMQKLGDKSEKQNDLIKLVWIFTLLFFIAFGLASHAAPTKTESILLTAPNLYGKHFFSVLINSPDPKEAPKNLHIFGAALPASASAVFSKGQIEFLVSKLNSDAVDGSSGENKKLHVIDTSTHAHGFVNNMQIVWLDQSNDTQEKTLLDALRKKRLNFYTVPENVEYYNLDVDQITKMGGQKIQVQANDVETEQQYLKSKKIDYTRMPFASDDLEKFDDKKVEQLVAIVKHLRKDDWLHFHNEEGSKFLGTPVLVADILKNAPNTTLADIVARQNEYATQVKAQSITPSARLEKIYAYAKEQGPDFKKSFARWNK